MAAPRIALRRVDPERTKEEAVPTNPKKNTIETAAAALEGRTIPGILDPIMAVQTLSPGAREPVKGDSRDVGREKSGQTASK